MTKLRFSRAAVAVLVCLVCAGSLLAKDFVKPEAKPAKTYVTHDDHANEKVAIGTDPYNTQEKAKIFPVDFESHGYLPIFFVVTNDSDQPISIANIQVTLVTAGRDKITPSGDEDLFRRLNNPQANTHPIPIPIPQKKVKGILSQKERDEIDSAQFVARAVEPHSTQSGFLFFDVQDIPNPLTGAHIDITGVNDAKGAELMYFEIQMGN